MVKMNQITASVSLHAGLGKSGKTIITPFLTPPPPISVITVSQFVHQVIHCPKNWIIIAVIVVVVTTTTTTIIVIIDDKTRRVCVEIP